MLLGVGLSLLERGTGQTTVRGNIFRAPEKSREPFSMGVSGEENHQVLEKM